MRKTLMNNIKPPLTGLSDSDFLARLDAVYRAIVDDVSYPNLPVDMPDFKAAIEKYAVAASAVPQGGDAAILERDRRRADALEMLRLLGENVERTCEDAVRKGKSLPEFRRFVDTVATSSTTQIPRPSVRLPPLDCSNKDGHRYVRPPHIQAEICRALQLSPPECIDAADSLHSETLVFLIRLTHQSDSEMCGRLIEKLKKRIRGHALRFCQEMDTYDEEQFVLNVDIQVLALVLANERSRQRDILEVAFGQTVKRLALDQFKKFGNSTAGNIVDIAVDSTDEDWDGEAAERPIEFLSDTTSGPEDILLNLDLRTQRHRLLHKALKAVSDCRHREAAILHWGRGMPIASSRRGKRCLTRYFRKDEGQIKYWLKIAMQQMRDALGIGKRPAAGNLT